jgi:hypothetical protein
VRSSILPDSDFGFSDNHRINDRNNAPSLRLRALRNSIKSGRNTHIDTISLAAANPINEMRRCETTGTRLDLTV